jgi:fumarate reductase flavoprotein subunit
MLDMRTGEPVLVRAKATLLATGGGPTMYKYHTPSGDKSCDGLAMALRAGLPLRDMEMVQFHPTGLLAGPGTRMTGTVLEEGLRGAGGYLTDATGQRFMAAYDPMGERATRDIVSRSIMYRIREGHASPNGGVFIEMAHLGPAEVRKKFKGMVERCTDCGFDLAAGRVEVVPTAHYMMGGVVFDADCSTPMPRLFAAGEDTGGVHGANRLGGNGVANSTVFGGLAGDAMAPFARRHGPLAEPDRAAIDQALDRIEAPFRGRGGDLNQLRDDLHDAMWNDVGILRTETGLRRGLSALEGLDQAARPHGGSGATAPTTSLARLAEPEEPRAGEPSHRPGGARAHAIPAARISARDFSAPGDLAASRYTVAALGPTVPHRDRAGGVHACRPGQFLQAAE